MNPRRPGGVGAGGFLGLLDAVQRPTLGGHRNFVLVCAARLKIPAPPRRKPLSGQRISITKTWPESSQQKTSGYASRSFSSYASDRVRPPKGRPLPEPAGHRGTRNWLSPFALSPRVPPIVTRPLRLQSSHLSCHESARSRRLYSPIQLLFPRCSESHPTTSAVTPAYSQMSRHATEPESASPFTFIRAPSIVPRHHRLPPSPRLTCHFLVVRRIRFAGGPTLSLHTAAPYRLEFRFSKALKGPSSRRIGGHERAGDGASPALKPPGEYLPGAADRTA